MPKRFKANYIFVILVIHYYVLFKFEIGNRYNQAFKHITSSKMTYFGDIIRLLSDYSVYSTMKYIAYIEIQKSYSINNTMAQKSSNRFLRHCVIIEYLRYYY